MQTALLTTKLYVPTPGQTLVLRPRLTTALSQALTRSLTLVSAPAGYGKTTLVSSWLREVDAAIAWLSLDEGDNDPVGFLQYFLTALRRAVPTLGIDLSDLLRGMQSPPLGALVNLLINEIAAHNGSIVLVLDDFHCVNAHPVLEMLSSLLDHLPPQMHLVILSRYDPPLPLSRLRVRDQLLEIRVNQLRFTRDEIAEFLNDVVGLRLSAGDLAALEARTEGWIAGLQLASIAMQSRRSTSGSEDISDFVSEFTGSHYYVMDYLSEEVLKLQAPTVRTFLRQTSILGRLCGPLCSAVVGVDATEPVDGQAMLEALAKKNLFVIPLDDEGHWYRYHHLFADVLNRHPDHSCPSELPELHRRACRWYERNGFMPEAIHHALMAGDKDRAAELVEEYGCPLLLRGEAISLLNLIEAVEPQSQTRPWLAIRKAWALTLTGRLDRAEQALRSAELLISSLEPTAEVSEMLGCVAAARAQRANLQGSTRLAVQLSQQALALLTATDPMSCNLRAVSTCILGDARWVDGDLEAARMAYDDAATIAQPGSNVNLAIIAFSNLAGVLAEQGRLQQSARTYSETLQMIAQAGGQRPPLAAAVYAGLAGLLYEWNDLEAAANHTHRCIEISRQWGNTEILVAGYGLLARLEHARHHPERAHEAMRAAEQLARGYSLSPRRSVWLASVLARLWIAQGDLERASSVVENSGITPDDVARGAEMPYLREFGYATLLRVLLARGDYDAALPLSERLLQKAELTDRIGRVIEILVLQALAHQAKKDLAKALSAIGRAFSLAQPEGYARVFLDEGEPMAKLLYQARVQRIGAGFAAELLSAINGDSSANRTPARALIEPLSTRELEVLKLIEDGCSNQEIADQLVISIKTAKRHISNIYGKLGAKSRTQAISLGKELGLFK